MKKTMLFLVLFTCAGFVGSVHVDAHSRTEAESMACNLLEAGYPIWDGTKDGLLPDDAMGNGYEVVVVIPWG